MNKEPNKPNIVGTMMFILLIAVIFRFVFEMSRPEKPVQKPPAAVEEAVNAVDNRVKLNTASKVATDGLSIFIYRTEVDGQVIYFTNKGGIWGHPK